MGVAMIWAPSMEAAYDITILERPERHESMHAAEERQHRGPPKHTLHECIEVLPPPRHCAVSHPVTWGTAAPVALLPEAGMSDCARGSLRSCAVQGPTMYLGLRSSWHGSCLKIC